METPARLNPQAPLFIPLQRFHFRPPLPVNPTLQFPPPPPPPPSFPQLHQIYTHFHCIYPLLQKPLPPPLQPPPPPPFSNCYTETSFQTSPPSPTVDSYANPSTVRVDSAMKTVRFRPKVDKYPGRRGRKELPPPEKSTTSRERKSIGSIKAVWAKKNAANRDIIPLKEDEGKTTIMIKNIPSKYTREMLMQFLDKHCNRINERACKDLILGDEVVSAYDFVYLPIDFFSRLNKGYAFVNFVNPKSVWKFYDAFNGESWDCFNSPKRIDIVSAKIQGKKALVDHFERSHFCCDTDEYLPLGFDPPRDGSGAPIRLQPVGNRFSPRLRPLH